MEKLLNVSSSPHIRTGESNKSIMRDVAIALTPAAAFGIYNFGFKAFIVLMIAIVSAVVTEALCQKLRGVDVTVNDYSALVTGLLLGMNLPMDVPLWLPMVGSIFAIAIVKQAFGGLGHNFMNPALAARAMLLASWPVEMTNWTAVNVDAVSSATPLAIIKGGLDLPLPSLSEAFIGRVGGCIGETSALFLLIGAGYLIYRGVITLKIPGIYIGTFAVLAFVFTGFNAYETLLHVLTGGLVLGAFFMATDYASSPITARGQIIYAVGLGVLTAVIRFQGSYPEGVSYSILIMNVVAPLIDRYSKPRVFGGAK